MSVGGLGSSASLTLPSSTPRTKKGVSDAYGRLRDVLHDLVEKMLAEYGEGSPYFTALDAALRVPWVFNLLLAEAGPRRDWDRLIVSGQFGADFAKWLNKVSYGSGMPLIVLPGGLRHGDQHLRWPQVETGRRYLFLDDSLYEGRTFDVASDVVKRSGGVVVGGIVAYDGSKAGIESVESLYRWRDRT
jgi:hypothetical protein